MDKERLVSSNYHRITESHNSYSFVFLSFLNVLWYISLCSLVGKGEKMREWKGCALRG